MTPLRTGGANDRPILNAPIRHDPDPVYRCQYTEREVRFGDHVFLGAVVPQVRGAYVCRPDAKAAFRASRQAFNESEANCNTCRHLQRVPHEKSRAGFLYGRCECADLSAHPYASRIVNGVMPFHPDDFMGMPCYEAREQP